MSGTGNQPNNSSPHAAVLPSSPVAFSKENLEALAFAVKAGLGALDNSGNARINMEPDVAKRFNELVGTGKLIPANTSRT